MGGGWTQDQLENLVGLGGPCDGWLVDLVINVDKLIIIISICFIIIDIKLLWIWLLLWIKVESRNLFICYNV